MKTTTLCYIINNEQVLMLYRNKKKQDANEGKMIGVGGKLEENETIEECMLREVEEETGLVCTQYELLGDVFFRLPAWEDELTYIYRCTGYTGKLKPCTEGELRWVNLSDVMDCPLWPGDRLFLPQVLAGEPVHLVLEYDEKDQLITK
ncbi:MAG: 8-oxo-dGTP diphosphatase [Erysipelotrichaceae bacterium]|nr:8-oxo-dGTP diphosphatase [Erysipelotrichaceae bacterium]